jgi:ClpX C4-type zinc finger
MHDETSQGTDFFKCDFCQTTWEDSNPMVEGHRGSLICAKCLRIAYERLVVHNDPDATEIDSCCMCLEARQQAIWISPVTDAKACLRCIKLAARALEQDDDVAWSKPAPSSTDQD